MDSVAGGDLKMNAREQNDRMHQCPQRAAATLMTSKWLNQSTLVLCAAIHDCGQSIPSSIGFHFVAESRRKFKRRSFQGWANTQVFASVCYFRNINWKLQWKLVAREEAAKQSTESQTAAALVEMTAKRRKVITWLCVNRQNPLRDEGGIA
jgi:hypothetical protein